MAKPRPPKLNMTALLNRKHGLQSFTARFEQFEKLRMSKELPVQYVAFEALCSVIGAYIEGYDEKEIKAACPKEWGDEFVSVPAPLILALVDAWRLYQRSPTGVTLGEAFGIEGGGQGKKPKKDLQRNRDRRRKLAADVENEYLASGHEGVPISREQARQIVAEREGVSIQTVELAEKEYGPGIRDTIRRHGFFEEGG
jgi:hypothetical protein